MDFSGGGGGSGGGQDMENLQQSLNAVVLQLLQNQVRKTCFDKCFPSNRFPDRMSKSEHICLAKCMDRMFEAHSIVVKASVEMAQNLASQE
eukprot:CAMPEP_0181471434 /NCGR_PEP_ID=MMETSP1110-20121109/39071_1 /TAXON_ID=174948 /ORGANISM="Symbiodinium sp., Strain CCMP421" /LENGTH=90 /DNA_ID=CAMNT_0023596449 /DNA_START=34 /DNA_END=306 /DNA_ORIENTATION=-